MELDVEIDEEYAFDAVDERRNNEGGYKLHVEEYWPVEDGRLQDLPGEIDVVGETEGSSAEMVVGSASVSGYEEDLRRINEVVSALDTDERGIDTVQLNVRGPSGRQFSDPGSPGYMHSIRDAADRLEEAPQRFLLRGGENALYGARVEDGYFIMDGNPQEKRDSWEETLGFDLVKELQDAGVPIEHRQSPVQYIDRMPGHVPRGDDERPFIPTDTWFDRDDTSYDMAFVRFEDGGKETGQSSMFIAPEDLGGWIEDGVPNNLDVKVTGVVSQD